ncbi:DUF3108 domain-containing protein [Polaromonas sp.]|uniref:DUF3108 domain-containing protein n=1 Tax=Polaromonas sp. TaxID=1869339 RepID=UPI003BAD31BB
MATGSGAPPWRLLLALGALVVAAHVLVLQASPTRLGARLDPDAFSTRAFATRSIEPKPAPEAAPAPVARPAKPVRPARPKPAAQPAPAPDSASDQPPPPVDVAQAAMDSVASDGQQNPADSAPTSADSTPTSATPTAAPGLPASAAAASTPVTTSTLPAGPKTTPVTAMALQDSVLLKYKAIGASKGLTYRADAELVWKNAGSQYEASMKVSALFIGSRSMTSAGQITPTGLAPTRFADKFRSEQAAHFEADKGKITFSANTPDLPWIEGAQDRVSVFLQMGGMLAGKPDAFPAGSSITLYTAGPRDADTWTFTVETEEKLSLPSGEVTALKLTRMPRREYDQKVEVWYAPSLGYLPVRNRITQQNGDFVDQQLSEFIRP